MALGQGRSLWKYHANPEKRNTDTISKGSPPCLFPVNCHTDCHWFLKISLKMSEDIFCEFYLLLIKLYCRMHFLS